MIRHGGGDARELEADPAAVMTVDPTSGISTGFLILNVTQETT
jgi:hypothetical protein